MTEIFEQLPPDTTLEALLERKKALEQLLEYKKKFAEQAPEGSLRVSRSKNRLRFYQMTKKGSTTGKYLSKEHADLIKTLAQKDYNSIVLPALRTELKLLSSLIRQMTETPLAQIYSQQNRQRQALIEPVTLTDKEYALRWQSRQYESKGFSENTPELLTSTGIRVRSKSEIIIADTLTRLHIPFLYEYPLKLKSLKVHPDFICLNLRTRKEFIWEHFGMMSDSEYAAKAVSKMFQYQNSGWMPGKNMIISMETAKQPLSARTAELLAKHFLVG